MYAISETYFFFFFYDKVKTFFFSYWHFFMSAKIKKIIEHCRLSLSSFLRRHVCLQNSHRRLAEAERGRDLLIRDLFDSLWRHVFSSALGPGVTQTRNRSCGQSWWTTRELLVEFDSFYFGCFKFRTRPSGGSSPRSFCSTPPHAPVDERLSGKPNGPKPLRVWVRARRPSKGAVGSCRKGSSRPSLSQWEDC